MDKYGLVFQRVGKRRRYLGSHRSIMRHRRRPVHRIVAMAWRERHRTAMEVVALVRLVDLITKNDIEVMLY